jgi:hypothetical protein
MVEGCLWNIPRMFSSPLCRGCAREACMMNLNKSCANASLPPSLNLQEPCEAILKPPGAVRKSIFL